MHFLVIPKVKSGLSRLSKATEDNIPTLGHLLYVAQKVAKQGKRSPSPDSNPVLFQCLSDVVLMVEDLLRCTVSMPTHFTSSLLKCAS